VSVEIADEKLKCLKTILSEMGSVLVTFSGGVDSAFLAKVAYDVLRDRAVAMTAISESLPKWEQKEAILIARQIGIRHLSVFSRELDDPRYAANPVNRCYFCKGALFALAVAKAKVLGLRWVADGTHQDDLKDHRPGRQAAKEWGVRSPLLEAGYTKAEIRQASRQLGLSVWDKPAGACLASRIPTGIPVTIERLWQVERCEEALKRMGFRSVRARWEDPSTVRLELEPSALERLADPQFQDQVVEAAWKSGFRNVCVDLVGCRTM
jgi:uncharacterized protein